LISTIVLVLHGKLVKVASDVVCSTHVSIPIGVDVIGISSHISRFLLTSEGVIEPLPVL
jgi:hypothetical protein